MKIVNRKIQALEKREYKCNVEYSGIKALCANSILGHQFKIYI